MPRLVIGILIATMMAGGSASAHHSSRGFLMAERVSIEGHVESVLFANPHAVLTIKTRESGTYVAEWSSERNLARRGVTKTTVKVGDYVVLSVAPPRHTGERKLLVLEVHIPADGWHWSLGGNSQAAPRP